MDTLRHSPQDLTCDSQRTGFDRRNLVCSHPAPASEGLSRNTAGYPHAARLGRNTGCVNGVLLRGIYPGGLCGHDF